MVALLFAACTIDYESSSPSGPPKTSGHPWVGIWLWSPLYPVRADTLVNQGKLYMGYWSWDHYGSDGFFSHIQANGNVYFPAEDDKVAADTGTWRLLPGKTTLIERHREKCVGYNRRLGPELRSWKIPCRTEIDTLTFRMHAGFWIRNQNQTSQRWEKLE